MTMKKLFSIFASVMVLVVSGCAPQADMEAERAAIHKFHDECMTAMLAGNVDCFAEDGQMLPPHAPPIKGKGAIDELISQIIDDPNFSASHDIVKVDVSRSGDLANIHYTYELIKSDPDGNPITEQGKAIYILRKKPQAGWKIWFDIWNADTPEINTGPEDQTDSTVDEDVQTILALEQNIFAAQNAGDLEGWLSFFTDDVFIMPPNEPALRGKEAVRAYNLPIWQQFDLHEETDEREVEAAGNWGYIRAHWKWTLIPKGGDDAVIDVGDSIWIVRRQADGSWKLSMAIWNSDNPPTVP
jgi:uncharacterized protein (TIGR02246 family)